MSSNGDQTVGGILTVTGNTNLNSNLAVAANKSTTLGGTLEVAADKSTTLGGTLTVVGDKPTALGGTLAVTGNTTLSNNLTVSGDKPTLLGGTLAVTGITTLSNNLIVAADKSTTLNGTLAVVGDKSTTLGGTLDVTGNTDLRNNLTVVGDKPTTLGGTLGVTGIATFSNNVIVTGNLTVNGTTTAIQSNTLEVKDAAILIADANVTDTLQTGLQIQYKSIGAAAVKFAGLKRIPVTGEFVLFKESANQIENATDPDTYASLMADSFTSASDKNLKKNIVPLDGALDKIDAIRGVYHDWIDEEQSKDRQIGVIAQEIQAVYPELVSQSGNGYLSVNYPKLTAVLLQSVKELKAMVLALVNKQ